MTETTLTITLTGAGTITVSGPIDNGLISYGMLELGRQAIQNNIASKATRVQVAAPGDLPPGLVKF